MPTGALASILYVPDLAQIERIHREGGEELWDFVHAPIAGKPIREQYAREINDILMTLRKTATLLRKDDVRKAQETEEVLQDFELLRPKFPKDKKSDGRELLESYIKKVNDTKETLLDENWKVLTTSQEWGKRKKALAAFFPGADDGLNRKRILQLLNDPKLLMTFIVSICRFTQQLLPTDIEKLEPEDSSAKEEKSKGLARFKRTFNKSEENLLEEEEDIPAAPKSTATGTASSIGTDLYTAESIVAGSEGSRRSVIVTSHTVAGFPIGLGPQANTEINVLATHQQPTRGAVSSLGGLSGEGGSSQESNLSQEGSQQNDSRSSTDA